jgi:hypothetical protein
MRDGDGQRGYGRAVTRLFLQLAHGISLSHLIFRRAQSTQAWDLRCDMILRRAAPGTGGGHDSGESPRAGGNDDAGQLLGPAGTQRGLPRPRRMGEEAAECGRARLETLRAGRLYVARSAVSWAGCDANERWLLL